MLLSPNGRWMDMFTITPEWYNFNVWFAAHLSRLVCGGGWSLGRHFRQFMFSAGCKHVLGNAYKLCGAWQRKC